MSATLCGGEGFLVLLYACCKTVSSAAIYLSRPTVKRHNKCTHIRYLNLIKRVMHLPNSTLQAGPCVLPFLSDILHDNVDQLADSLASEFGWWPNGCRQSRDGAFMMLLGAAGTGTGFHSDLTEALSVGFEVSNGA